ncbi:odorant receptor 131-2-like [Xenentodon cancila]
MNFTAVEANGTKADNFLGTFVTAVTNIMIVVCLSITILSVNATMVHTFNRHHIFKLNPRYILFINLVVNDMIQLIISSSLYILGNVFRTMHIPLCVFLIFLASLATINTPLILAFMAAECYISVCFPLRYNNICTLKKTYDVVCIIWATSSLSVLPDIFILVATEQQQFFTSRGFCERDTVFRSSYSLNRRNAFHIFYLVLVWLTLFYTFFRILFAAKAANADVTKARNTLLLHGFQVLLLRQRPFCHAPSSHATTVSIGSLLITYPEPITPSIPQSSSSWTACGLVITLILFACYPTY